MKRKLKSFRDYPRAELLAFLEWHAGKKQVAYVEENGKLLAAGVARLVNDDILGLMDCELESVNSQARYMTDEGGDIIYSDYSACRDPRAYAGLMMVMMHRFPAAKRLTFRKRNRLFKRKTYDVKRFVSVALKQREAHAQHI